jgi:DNA-binding transcriptional ArsR family regulator
MGDERPLDTGEDRNLARVFAALGDETRLRLVTRLCEAGPQSIVRLRDGSAISRQAVAQHLKVLEAAGLASSARAGREQIWEVRANGLSHVQRYLALISDQWDAAARRLQEFVESERH